MTKRKYSGPKCGAATRGERRGAPCQRPAGWGTDHPGQGRCKLHGGSNPIRHGRYSKIDRPRISDLIESFEGDPYPLDLLPEVVLLRALLVDFISRYDHFVDAMHAWHATYTTEYRKAFDVWREQVIRLTEDGSWRDVEANDLPEAPDPLAFVDKPRQVLDISAAATLVDKVGAMVDRIERHKREGSISLETLDRVLEQLGVEVVAAAREAVTGEAERSALLTAVERRWGTVHVDTATPQGPAARRQLVN